MLTEQTLKTYKHANAQAKRLADKLATMRAEILEAMGRKAEIAVGKYKAVREERMQQRVDTAAIREFLGEKIHKFEVESVQVVLRVV